MIRRRGFLGGLTALLAGGSTVASGTTMLNPAPPMSGTIPTGVSWGEDAPTCEGGPNPIHYEQQRHAQKLTPPLPIATIGGISEVRLPRIDCSPPNNRSVTV